MAATKLYMSIASLAGTAVITRVEAGDHPSVRMSVTLYHARGGGQSNDTGYLSFDTAAGMTTGGGDAYFHDIERGRVAVVDVRHTDDGDINHFVDSVDNLHAGMTVFMSVDADRRALNSRLHSAGHLLADAVVAVEPNLHPVQGHHWPGEARVEFEGEPLCIDALRARLEARLAIETAADLPITVMVGDDGVRRVLVGQGAAVGCGGTHVLSTGALSGIVIRSIQAKKGRTRIGYDMNT